jgi:hypothetical protein
MTKEILKKLTEPYCVKKLSEEKYILLNRFYQPLGCGEKRELLNYEEAYPSKIINISDLELKKEIDENGGFIFFYNDRGNLPAKKKYAKFLSKEDPDFPVKFRNRSYQH